MNEHWKKIPEYAGYEVSDLGRSSMSVNYFVTRNSLQ